MLDCQFWGNKTGCIFLEKSLTFTQFKFSSLTWLFFIGYCLSLLFFYKVDVYHHHFFSSGFIVIAYHIFRIFFMLSLMWLCYNMGDFVLFFLTKDTTHREVNLSSALLTFFAGLSIWHIILLLLGFAGFYTQTMMALVTLFLFAVSLPRLNQWIRSIQTNPTPIYLPGLLLLLPPAFFFLIAKGLYPSGGHDYFTHYFPYYREVIESGSILPGRLWYHFYYDKGMGLFFLSMLLTDPLAPQLITATMIFASAGIIFLLIRQASSWRLLPWIGVALYLFFLIYTPGPPEAMHETGWSDLEKSHEPATILMFSIIWITINLAHTQQWKLWRIALVLNASALVIMSTAMAVFAGMYLSLAVLCFLIYKKLSAAISIAWALVAIGCWTALLLLINYLLTGVPDEQSVLFWWPVINFDKVNEWGGLMQITNLHFNRVMQGIDKIPLTFYFFKHNIITYLRLDIWGSFLLLILLSSLLLGKKRQSEFVQAKQTKIVLYTLGGFLILIACLSLFIGRDQPVSFYRFTSFTYAPALCFCLLLLATLLTDHKKWSLFILALGFLAAFSITGNDDFIPFHHEDRLIGFLLLLLIIGVYPKIRFAFFPALGFFLLWIILGHLSFGGDRNFFRVIKHASRFAIGTYSIAEAYKHQTGRPGAMSWGAIYPPMEKIWHLLPPKTRIWSWHVHSYCMLPDCDVEGFQSFQMSPHESTIYFGDPVKAKEILKKENLNYFFFSNQLDIRDTLYLSPLFSPQHIAQYFGIAWTDGNNTLLTWKEQAQLPIDADWLRRYMQHNDHVDRDRMLEMKKYSLLLK